MSFLFKIFNFLLGWNINLIQNRNSKFVQRAFVIYLDYNLLNIAIFKFDSWPKNVIFLKTLVKKVRIIFCLMPKIAALIRIRLFLFHSI